MMPDVTDFGYDPVLDRGAPISAIRERGAPPAPPAWTVPMQWLPPIGTQGTPADPGAPATCTAWASVYGLATYTQARLTNTPPTSDALIASPAYIYVKVRQQQGATGIPCLGTSYLPYFSMLRSIGTYSLAEAPYVADCATLWSDYGAMTPPTAKTFVLPAIETITTVDLDALKLLISLDCAVAYGTRLYTDWNAYRGTPPVYVGNGHIAHDKNGLPARHSMLLIGYNDDVGAFHVQNSQGPAWGCNGFVWMAYATFSALAERNAFYYG